MSKEMLIPKTVNPEIEKTVTKWVRDTFGPNASYDESLQPTIDQWGLPWFRAGAVVRNEEGKILMMHEGRVQVKKIRDEALKNQFIAEGYKSNEWVDGDGGWNLPSGRLKPGESFENGAIREVKEESNWDIAIKAHIHTRHSEKVGNAYILPVYFAEAISGPEQYRTKETSEIGWFSTEEICKMEESGMLRSPEFVMDSIKAYETYLNDY